MENRWLKTFFFMLLVMALNGAIVGQVIAFGWELDAGVCLSSVPMGVIICVPVNGPKECNDKGTSWVYEKKSSCAEWKEAAKTEFDGAESGAYSTPSSLELTPANQAGLTGLIGRVKEIGTSGNLGTKPLEEVIGGYIKTALTLVGVLFMALTFYGGYIWFIAREDEEEAKRARSIISMALIGLIVVLAAYFVTYFIIYRLTVASGTGLLE